MPKCAICGQPVTSGIVAHTECLPRWRDTKKGEYPAEGDCVIAVANGKPFVNITLEGSWELVRYFDGEWYLEWGGDSDPLTVRYWMPFTDLPEVPHG